MEWIVLCEMGVSGSASTVTSSPSASSARAIISPAMSRVTNLRDFECFSSLVVAVVSMMPSSWEVELREDREDVASFAVSSLAVGRVALLLLLLLSVATTSVDSSIPPSSTSNESLFPLLPNPNHRKRLVAFLIFAVSISNALVVPPITPSNKLLNNFSRCSLVCSSRPSRSCDLKRIPSSIERAFRFAHLSLDDSSSSSSFSLSSSPLIVITFSLMDSSSLFSVLPILLMGDPREPSSPSFSLSSFGEFPLYRARMKFTLSSSPSIESGEFSSAAVEVGDNLV
mmetsp:Transcript_15113/g.28727  ORF Transcript_15113/g.28727 Transcript_15113/m.28727 type:complete len:284 (-) Transcript_15113:552-1403(-)